MVLPDINKSDSMLQFRPIGCHLPTVKWMCTDFVSSGDGVREMSFLVIHRTNHRLELHNSARSTITHHYVADSKIYISGIAELFIKFSRSYDRLFRRIHAFAKMLRWCVRCITRSPYSVPDNV